MSEPLTILLQALGEAEVYLVGGTVRDLIELTPINETDLDVATNLSAQEVLKRCTQAGLRVVETGIQHGTVLVIADATHIEVTTFREPSSRDLHTPAHSIERDLSGRDFTCNAIAFDLRAKRLLDPFGGIADIEAHLLRAVGSPIDRLKEDPLRILRLIRFGPANHRTVDTSTLEAARTLAPLLEKVSVERIRSELDKILMSPAPAPAFRTMQQLDLLPYTVPELLPAVGFEQNRYHIHDVFEHTMDVLEATPPDLVLRWAAVFHDMGKPHTLSVDDNGERHFYSHEVVSERLAHERMNALRFSKENAQAITLIVRQHMRPMECGPAGARRIMRDLGSEFDRWRAFKTADRSPTTRPEDFAVGAAQFDELIQTERARAAGPAYGKLAVSGSDILALGIPAGPRIGEVLRYLEEIVIEDPDRNVHEDLLKAAREFLAHGKPSEE